MFSFLNTLDLEDSLTNCYTLNWVFKMNKIQNFDKTSRKDQTTLSNYL